MHLVTRLIPCTISVDASNVLNSRAQRFLSSLQHSVTEKCVATKVGLLILLHEKTIFYCCKINLNYIFLKLQIFDLIRLLHYTLQDHPNLSWIDFPLALDRGGALGTAAPPSLDW